MSALRLSIKISRFALKAALSGRGGQLFVAVPFEDLFHRGCPVAPGSGVERATVTIHLDISQQRTKIAAAAGSRMVFIEKEGHGGKRLFD
jgi:hypothetical protein